MAIGKSIRIYDLAKEVKQDTKRVMEDLRREGVDVSVASNSVPYEVAEKVRGKYFPKTEIAPKRAIKIIKKAAKTDDAPAETDISVAPDAPEVEATPDVVAEPTAKPVVVEATAPTAEVEDAKPGTPSSVKKLTKKPAAETVVDEVVEAAETAPAEPRRVVKPTADVAEEAAPVKAVEAEVEAPPVAEVEVTAPVATVSKSGTTVKTLTLTKDALDKGIKAGDKLAPDWHLGSFPTIDVSPDAIRNEQDSRERFRRPLHHRQRPQDARSDGRPRGPDPRNSPEPPRVRGDDEG